MSKLSGRSATPTRRHWSDKAKARVVAYAATHGRTAALEHYHISSGQFHSWRTQANGELSKKAFGSFTKAKGGNSAVRHTMTTLVLARKLRRAIFAHIKAHEDITELELTGLLLINELLKRTP